MQVSGQAMSQRGNNATGRGRRRYHRPPPQKRSPLNCIVDEGALITGLTDATEHDDSLKTFVREGAINVFVPLYTLEKLNMLRSSPPPLNLDARKTLEWLDHITSVTESKSAGHVELQGPDDQYQTWQEVEKYLLPETPLSSNNAQSSLDTMTRALEENLTIQDEPGPAAFDSQHDGYPSDNVSLAKSLSPYNSPTVASLNQYAEHGTHHARGFSESSALSTPLVGDGLDGATSFLSSGENANIPSSIRPLLNYVVWRTHHEDVAKGISGKYILLTNDPNTRKQAQQFGVRAKLLSQLRFIVSRDKNKSSNQSNSKTAKNSGGAATSHENQHSADVMTQPQEDEDDEDEVVFKPKRPVSGLLNSSTPNVWDPDHFGRMPAMRSAPSQAIEDPVSSERGKPGPRGRGQSTSFRQKDTQRGRGSSSRGSKPTRYEKPIDPDSFARPQPQGRRGRGNFRRLWEPDG